MATRKKTATAETPPPTKKRELVAADFGGLFGTPTKSGVTVTESTALALSALWRAARVVSETIGTMPLKVYRRTADGREEARETTYWDLLHDEPNPDTSAVDFWSQVMWSAVLHGNGYAEIVRDGSGAVTALHWIPPWTVSVGKLKAGGLGYQVLTDQGTLALPASDVLHIKGPSPDGSCGYKLVSLARESLGLSLALDQFGSTFFGNGTQIGGVLEAVGSLSDAARENIREGWATAYQGVANAHKIPVLEEGLKFVPFSVNNETAQFLESRQYQISEVCRWVGVDPIFLYEYGRATWNNAEAQTRNFLQFSLNPWLCKIEAECNRKVISKADRRDTYAEYVRESVIQMDAKTQAEIWKTGVEGGWYTHDEIRRWLNLPKKPEQQTPQHKETGGNALDPNHAV